MVPFMLRPTFPLSLSQRNIWDLEQAYTGTSMNNISATLRLRGLVEPALLQQALGRVVAQDSAQRTRLVLEQGEPRWYTTEHAAESFPIYDFSHTSAEGVEEWAAALSR